MKNFCFTFLFSVIFLFNVHAQFIFNSCNNRPDYGDSLKGTQSIYDSTGITPGSSGANAIWNYSMTLINTKVVSHLYKDPSKTYDTSSTSSAPLFPSANLADLGTNGFLSYYQYESDSIIYLGNYYDLHNYQIVFGSEKNIVCLLGFGNSYSDSYHVHPVGVCTYDSYINRTATYDAYGTLNISKSSYSVARIKFVSQEIDTFCTPNVPPGFKIDTTYVWYDIASGQPVLSWEYYNDTVNHYINKYIYGYSYTHLPATTIATSIQEAKQKNDLILFPNPASRTFSFEGKSSSEKINFILINSTGMEVRSGNITTSGNTYKSSIDISTISSGIYFLKVTDGNSVWTEKLIKE